MSRFLKIAAVTLFILNISSSIYCGDNFEITKDKENKGMESLKIPFPADWQWRDKVYIRKTPRSLFDFSRFRLQVPFFLCNSDLACKGCFSPAQDYAKQMGCEIKEIDFLGSPAFLTTCERSGAPNKVKIINFKKGCYCYGVTFVCEAGQFKEEEWSDLVEKVKRSFANN